jgi:hypothetical protein
VARTRTIKLGAFVERGRKQQNGGTTPQGQFGLAAPWTAGGTGNDYGDLLVGRVAEFYQDTGVPRGEWRFWNVEGYLQDSWKARRDLTVEAGIRVAWMPDNEELNGLGTRLDPSAYDPAQGAYVDGDLTRPNGVLVASRGEIPLGMTESPGVAFMPRLNLAWDVRGDGDVVLRGGAGLFYNRVQGNYQYYVHFVDSLDARSIHLPRTSTWSLAAAKRLPWQQSLEVAYVGNRQDHLPNRTLSNYIVPGRLTGTVGNADLDNPLHRVALDASVAVQYRVFPAWSTNSWWYQFEATAEYHALQTSLTRRGSRIQYFLNYTFGKVLGTTGFGDYAVIDPVDPRNRSHGVPSSDRTHILNASYNLLAPDPIGPEGNGILRGLLNGWQVSGVTRYSSGVPFHLVLSGDIVQPEVQRAWWGTDAHQPRANDGNTGGVTPVFVGDPRLGNTGTGEKVLDIDRIGIPAFGESGPFQSPYYFRSPSRWNWDVPCSRTSASATSSARQHRCTRGATSTSPSRPSATCAWTAFRTAPAASSTASATRRRASASPTSPGRTSGRSCRSAATACSSSPRGSSSDLAVGNLSELDPLRAGGPGAGALRQELGHLDLRFGREQRGDGLAAPVRRHRAVAGAAGIPMHLEDGLDEVDDPVIGDPGTGVHPGFPGSVVFEGAVGHLDHQVGRRRVAIDVVARRPWHHGEIGLGLRRLADGEGVLDSNRVRSPEAPAQRVESQVHRRGVPTLLRAHLDDLPLEELDPIAGAEDAGRHEPLVVGASPHARPGSKGSRHGRQDSTAGEGLPA